VFYRTLVLTLLLRLLPNVLAGQSVPALSKSPSATDKTLIGTAQGLTAGYDAVLVYVCFSRIQPVQPLNCSGDNGSNNRRVKLINLGSSPFPITTSNGAFSIMLASAFPPGVYVWVDQITISGAGKATKSTTSTPIRVPVPLLRKASLSVSGYDSASRDIGAMATLDFDHGLTNEGWGETRFLMSGSYDDKWKHAPLTSNVTQNYSGSLQQLRQFRKTTYFVPYARAYHNNTQGIRVEQVYGASATQPVTIPHGYNVELSAGPQGIVDNLYAPGHSTNLFGLRLSSYLDHVFPNKFEIETDASYTPVFTQARAWSASGFFSLDIPISSRWSLHLAAIDNYYEIAPKTFNKNYLQPSIGLAFK
jgi:hypothetical protein